MASLLLQWDRDEVIPEMAKEEDETACSLSKMGGRESGTTSTKPPKRKQNACNREG
jgi:hypothetical protein